MKGTLIKGAIGATALVAVSLGSATAASQITSHQLADGAANHRVILDGSVHRADLATGVNGTLAQVKTQGQLIAAGEKIMGSLRQTVQGLDTLNGAYYSKAVYDVGNTNAGAIATVGCDNPTDVALSGGVQTLGTQGDNDYQRNTPVASSFPGRMDWSTNTPRPDRLDGWIVQFGGNAGATSDKDPQYATVWALCLPGSPITSKVTYTESE